MPRIIHIERRCCIECGRIYCGRLACPKCGAPGEPLADDQPDTEQPCGIDFTPGHEPHTHTERT